MSVPSATKTTFRHILEEILQRGSVFMKTVLLHYVQLQKSSILVSFYSPTYKVLFLCTDNSGILCHMHSFNSSSEYIDNSRDENRKIRMAVPAVAVILLLLNKATELPEAQKTLLPGVGHQQHSGEEEEAPPAMLCDPALLLLNRLLKALLGPV